MSKNVWIRSSGRPYFAAVQDALVGSSTGDFPADGLTRVVLEFTPHATPQRLASDSELHPLFSFHEYGGGGIALLEVGLTPTGAVKAVTSTGASRASLPGAAPPGGPVVAEVRFVPLTGIMTLYVNGAVIGTSSGGAGTLLPRGGRLGRFMLFNGMKGESRVSAAIRSCIATFSNGGDHTLTWAVDERTGPYLNATKSTGSFPALTATLTAKWYNPLVWPPLYGTVPTGDAGEAYRWEIKTAYTRQSVAKTVYSRVPA